MSSTHFGGKSFTTLTNLQIKDTVCHPLVHGLASNGGTGKDVTFTTTAKSRLVGVFEVIDQQEGLTGSTDKFLFDADPGITGYFLVNFSFQAFSTPANTIFLDVASWDNTGTGTTGITASTTFTVTASISAAGKSSITGTSIIPVKGGDSIVLAGSAGTAGTITFQNLVLSINLLSCSETV